MGSAPANRTSTSTWHRQREFDENIDLAALRRLLASRQPGRIRSQRRIRWGFGGGYPSRSQPPRDGEMPARHYFDRRRTFTGSDPAPGGPHEWEVRIADPHFFVGFALQGRPTVSISAPASANHVHDLNRRDFPGRREDSDFDRLGLAVPHRLSPWRAHRMPPPPPRHATAANHPAAGQPAADGEGALRTVHRRGRPPADGHCRREGSRWRYAALSLDAPTGRFANAADRQTPSTAPMQPASVPVTVTVNDGKGGTASDTVTIQ